MKLSISLTLGLVALASVASATDRHYQTACTNQKGDLQVQIFPIAQNEALVGVTETYANGYKNHSSQVYTINFASQLSGNSERFVSQGSYDSYLTAFDNTPNEITYFERDGRPGQVLTCQVVYGHIQTVSVFQSGHACNEVLYAGLKECEKSGKYFAVEKILREMHPDGDSVCDVQLTCY